MNPSRSPKLIGDFGEGLATYALIRGGYEVAHVDHVGADLIAEKDEKRIAVSVKTRNRVNATKESDMVVIKSDDIEKLKYFSDKFGMEPIFCQIICQAKNNIIHMFMIKISDVEANMKKAQNGYSLSFSDGQIEKTKNIQGMTYSQWNNETINVI